MRLSIIIPVFNEKDTVRILLERVLAVPLEKEIIIVDDGSTDGTRQILQRLAVSDFTSHISRLEVVLQNTNQGKGAAIRAGLEHATGEYVVFQDADLELNPSEIPRLVAAADTRHPVVYGSRFLLPQKTSFLNRAANAFLTILTNVLYGARLTDMETCYKLCPRQLLLSLGLTACGFEIEPEITCRILRKGYRIREVPVSYAPRVAGKKINWKDGFRAIYYLLKYRIP